MANKWNCDVCGRQTFMNPATKLMFEQDGIRKIPVIDPKTNQPLMKMKDGKAEVHFREEPNMIPVLDTMKRQNLHNGTVETIQIQKVEYLEEPAIIVKLKIGHENVQRDFCRACLNEYIGPELKALSEKLWVLNNK